PVSGPEPEPGRVLHQVQLFVPALGSLVGRGPSLEARVAPMQPFQRQPRQKITHANRAADPDPEPVSMRPSKALGSAPLALGLLCLVSVTSSALAQRTRGEWRMSCRDHEDDDWGETYCDIKEQTLRPGAGPIRVDAHPNGGVAVVGWDKNEILLRSKITAHARTEEDARVLADEVRIQVSGNTISADGPSTHRRQWWSVSFELRVPNHSDL